MSHRRRPEFSESWISAKNTFLHDSDMVHNSIIKFLSNSSGYVDSDKPGLKLRKFWKNVRQWWYHSLVDYLVQSKRKFCRSEKKNIRFITIYPKYFDGNTYIHTCVCAYVHTYVHTHTHTHIYIYIYIYTHTYDLYWLVVHLMQNLHLKLRITVKCTGVDSLLAGDHSPHYSITKM